MHFTHFTTNNGARAPRAYMHACAREIPTSVRKGGLDLEGEVTLVHTKRKTAVTLRRARHGDVMDGRRHGVSALHTREDGKTERRR